MSPSSLSPKPFDGVADALEALNNIVASMGGVVETQVADAINACARRDTALARAVIERDRRADAAQKDIERAAVAILGIRQPTPPELRAVLAAYKIAGELERVGDLAKSMSKRTVVLNEFEPIEVKRGIAGMGRIAAELLKHVLDAYSHRDTERAVAVWMRDQELDAYYNSLFRELVSIMAAAPHTITPGAHLLFVAKNIERVGDHCTNIAEAVHSMITGQDVLSERPRASEIERWSEPAP